MRLCKTDGHEEVVRWFYDQEQPEFFSTYHKAQGSPEECVADTVASLSDGCEFYVVESDGQRAAFFVKTMYEGVGVLEGFHVLPSFRVPLFMHRFWDAVASVFGCDIHIGVSAHNKPAIRHLVRNGFLIVGDTDYAGKAFTLLLKRIK